MSRKEEITMSSDPKSITRRSFLKKSVAAAALGGAGTLSLFGPRSVMAARGKINLRLGTFHSEDFIDTKVSRLFAKILMEKSNGEIVVDVFPSAQLGGEKDLAEGLRLGTVDIAINSGVIAQWVPEWGINELPFMFKDQAHAVRALQGPIMEALNPKVEKAGFHVLGAARYTPRLMYTKKPIKTMADLKGLKIRVPEVPIFIETFKLLGTTPTPIAAPEIYSALQTGVVEAQDGGPDWVYTLKSYEILKYIIKTEHIIGSALMLMSQARMKKLPKDAQQVIETSADEAYKWYVEESKTLQQASIDRLVKQGMTLVTDIDRDAMVKAVSSLQDKFAKQKGIEDLMQKVRQLA
jgi:tripartite ATP-independent transporter DctP family solute receptor